MRRARFFALVVVAACSRRVDPPAPVATTAPSAVPACACEPRQVCVSGRCVYDSIDYQVDQLALGAPKFACALYANGEVWCAGKSAPARVAGIDGKATEIAAGPDRACALAAGAAFCWDGGSNDAKRVPGVADARRLGASAKRTCATSWTSGSVACWGSDLVAHPVKGVETYSRVAVGDARSCATSGRSVVCWTGDGPATAVSDAEDVREIAQTEHALCYRDGDGEVRCRGGAFGARFSKVPLLRGAITLAAGSDIVCGITPGKEVSCSDGKDAYRVTLGDSGTHTSARLLAASGAYTINVHASDDVVDADDELPIKSVVDRLGQFGPTEDAAQVRYAKRLPPLQAAPTGPSISSCDSRPIGDTCVEYKDSVGAYDEVNRCRNEKGKWSSSPCTRDGVIGTCVIGTALDRGATLVIYASKSMKSAGEARAMCVGGYAGTFTAP